MIKCGLSCDIVPCNRFTVAATGNRHRWPLIGPSVHDGPINSAVMETVLVYCFMKVDRCTRNQEEDCYVETGKMALSLPKNLNLYWAAVTGLAVWFLFVHAPIFLTLGKRWKDVPLIFHLMGAGGVYVACIHNTLITPSWSKLLHVFVGRVGLLLGFWGFGWGMYMSWWRAGVELSASIPLTVGGVLQVISQVMGYQAIQQYQRLNKQLESLPPDVTPETVVSLQSQRSGYLKSHIGSMLGLFVQACSIPAALRLTDSAGVPGLVGGIIGLNIVQIFYSANFYGQIPNTASTDELTPLAK